MKFSKQPISHFMTAMPHSIEPHQSLESAQKRMDQLGCRHLPVRSGGKLVGILSDRDLGFLSRFSDIDLSDLSVKDAMTYDPLTVSSDVPLNQVTATMYKNHIGCMLIVNQQGTLLGIFTDTDALRILSESSDASSQARSVCC